jgi:hypothetical protein
MSQPLLERQSERISTRQIRQQSLFTLNCIVCRTNIPVSFYDTKNNCQCTMSRIRQDSDSTVIVIKSISN